MNAYWLFTPDQLERALDEHLHSMQQTGTSIEAATEIGSQIRAFLMRSDAAAAHGLRIEPQPIESSTRGPGVTG